MGIKNVILDSIIPFIPQPIRRRIINNSEKSSIKIFSQEGEDRLLERFIGTKKYGIYVDVGAHHPTFISNTYYFYRKGWRGINIDAQPGSMSLFKKIRPYDINIEQPISEEEGISTFYMFNTPELNTFDETKIKDFLKFTNVKLVDKIKLHTRTLENVLDGYLPQFGTTNIDFLTVDVEGFDLKVLKSNNWKKYRPNFVLAEDLFSNVMESHHGELNNYMISVGYTMKAKTVNTIFFQKNE